MFSALLIITACSARRIVPHSGLIERLRDRGPVVLSTENPYLAANLMLSKEMELSSELRGFIKHRGAPAAIEVHKSAFGPLKMIFYYPENGECYELEDLDGTWIIRGPLLIERERMKEIASLTRNTKGQPRLALEDVNTPSTELQFGQVVKPTPQVSVTVTPGKSQTLQDFTPSRSGGPPSEDPFLAKLDAAERERSQAFKSPALPEYPKEGWKDPILPSKLSASEDQQFVLDLIQVTGVHPAELTPKGDLVHHVTYPGETLSMIARWYTFDRENAPRLARINRLANPDILRLGDEIVVPGYMLKNKNRLSETVVRAFLARE